MATARVSARTLRVSTQRRRTSPRQGPRAPEHLVDRMVVEAGLVVVAYTDRLMRALEPLLQERFGKRQDSLTLTAIRQDAAPSLDEVFERVQEGHVSREFLARMFHGIDQQAANDLSRVVAISPDQTLRGAAEMQAGFIERNTELIQMEERARKEVRAIIEQPIAEGVRVEDIREQIQERMGVVRSRAELIARDQTLKTYGQIQEARQTDAGIEEYTWSTSLDERVRSRHSELEGTTQRWDSPPVVDRKSGRREHPGLDYQCRCAAIPILPTGDLPPESETRPSVRPERLRSVPPANDVPDVPDPLVVERERLAAERAEREAQAERQRLEEAERQRLAAEAEATRQRAAEAARAEAARQAEAEARSAALVKAARRREFETNPTAWLRQQIPGVRINADAPAAVRRAVADAVEKVNLPGIRVLALAPKLASKNGSYEYAKAKVALQTSRVPMKQSLPDRPGPGKVWSISYTAKTEAEAVSKTTYHELGHHAHLHESQRFPGPAAPTVIGLAAERLVAARWDASDREYLTDYAVDPRTPPDFRASEYFAEAFAAYHTEPAWLRRVAPKAYQLVEAVLTLRRSAT
jgi:SPP1 gp7 family putative phage head morphogenesis protein